VKIAVLKEQADGERRVSATPETVKKFIALGAELAVETGAGEAASISDADYVAAGALVGPREQVLSGAEAVFGVQGPDPEGLDGVAPGALLIAALNPFGMRARVDAMPLAGIEALALEFIPRITRAQSMDILSSQANLGGYKAVLDAAAEYGRAFPMMMTAAGTISAARVFIMGVGVAGLQAIATARRLGAIVSATDVRAAVKEQIESLGAKAIFVDKVKGIEGEGAGGYATEMSDEYKAAQAELVSGHLAKQDIVITTALIPGRPGAAADLGRTACDHEAGLGGRGPRRRAGRECRRAQCWARSSPATVSRSSATATCRAASPPTPPRSTPATCTTFLSAFWDKEAKRPILPDDDEIVQGVRLTRGGQVVSQRLLG
jgi:NAD(P) transhydrogenase subunit alpha